MTDDRTHAAVAGVTVVAKSPSATYRTTTDAKGAYRFLSMLPDNYAISFTSSAYQPYSVIVVVLNGSQQTVNAVLSTSLKTIASIHSRSSGSAFQRGHDHRHLHGDRRADPHGHGKAFNANENELLRSIPSVTIDKTGTVSIRGGFAFEAAYEFEGIDYTTPSANLQNTLQNVANFNLLNGVGSVQLIPGAGDATHGDTGTGLVLFTAKNGTFPTYLHADVEAQMFPYLHQLGLEWGWATPNQKLSNYAGFIGIRQAFQYGIPGTAANTLGTLGTNAATLGSTIDPNLVYYSPQFLSSNDFLDNLIWRFGKNNSQKLQFFIQSQTIKQTLDYGGFQFLPYISGGTTAGRCAPYPVIGPNGPVNSPQQQYSCDSLLPLFPGQPNTYAFVSQADSRSSPFLAYKLEYATTLGASSLLTARFWRTFVGQSQDMPAQGIFAAALRRHAHRRPARRHDADRFEESAQVRLDLRLGGAVRQSLRLHVVHGVYHAGVRRDLRDHAPESAAAAALHLHGALAQQQPGGAGRARARLFLAGLLRAAARPHGLRLLELVLSRRRSLPVRGRRRDRRAAAVRPLPARHAGDVGPLEGRGRRAARRLQLSDSDPVRRAGVHSGRGTPAAVRAALRRVLRARSARHASAGLRPHALDAAAQPAGRRREPRTRTRRLPAFRPTTTRPARRRSTAGRWPTGCAPATPISSTG